MIDKQDFDAISRIYNLRIETAEAEIATAVQRHDRTGHPFFQDEIFYWREVLRLLKVLKSKHQAEYEYKQDKKTRHAG